MINSWNWSMLKWNFNWYPSAFRLATFGRRSLGWSLCMQVHRNGETIDFGGDTQLQVLAARWFEVLDSPRKSSLLAFKSMNVSCKRHRTSIVSQSCNHWPANSYRLGFTHLCSTANLSCWGFQMFPPSQEQLVSTASTAEGLNREQKKENHQSTILLYRDYRVYGCL